MKVQLVSLTVSQLPGEIVPLSAEELITYVARVSNPSNQMNSETAPKLIGYLIKNNHWSPFEMADMCLEIITSRGIAQQILRHRSFSFQEFSQRYAEVTEMEPTQLRKAGSTNRQSSSEEFDPKINVDCGNDIVPHDQASLAIEDHLSYCENLYKALLEAGVAKECARFVLPITTQTKLYMKGSIRSWIHYLLIRLDEHTQLEHRQIANEIRVIFKENFPNIAKALNF